MTTPLILPTIAPLIRRHAEDAAFYWSQHDMSNASPRLRLPGLERFSQLLLAHLEGLDAAGASAFEPAWCALERWKKPAEAFVAAYIAFSGDRPDEWSKLMPAVMARPGQLQRGVIGALAWLPQARALTHIHTLSRAGACPIGQVAALRALYLLGHPPQDTLAQPLRHYLASDQQHVRAAAWRLAARLDHDVFANDMPVDAGEDRAIGERAESALACAVQYARIAPGGGRAGLAAGRLLGCVNEQALEAASATGWNRLQATRRLARWSTWLAVVLAPGHPHIADLLRSLPPRVALSFIAAHGDPAWLPYVVDQARTGDTARFAGWTWETLTGISLPAAGLALEDRPGAMTSIVITEERFDTDLGLPLPDADALAAYALPALQPGGRFLRGQPVSPRHALSVLQSGTQAERLIAQYHLTISHPLETVPVRAPACRQRKAMSGLDAALSGKAVA